MFRGHFVLFSFLKTCSIGQRLRFFVLAAVLEILQPVSSSACILIDTVSLRAEGASPPLARRAGTFRLSENFMNYVVV